jgi:hypothetical protein
MDQIMEGPMREERKNKTNAENAVGADELMKVSVERQWKAAEQRAGVGAAGEAARRADEDPERWDGLS